MIQSKKNAIQKTGDKVFKTILTFFIILMMLFEMMLYYIPHAIYEIAQDVFYNAREAYDAEYYKGSGNHWVKGAIAWAREVLNSGTQAISDFLSLFRNTDRISESLTSSDMENGINIMSDMKAPADSVYYKLTETKAKYAERRDSIKASFMQSGLLGILRTRCMEEMRNDRRFNAKDVFEGVELDFSGCNQNMSDFEALEYLCLFSVLNDQDPSQLKLSDYMKWLGYAPKNKKEQSHLAVLRIDINGTGGQGIYAKPWEGEYMPAYLTAEARKESEKAGETAIRNTGETRFSSTYRNAYSEKYSEYVTQYGTPGIDMLITAYVDDFSTPYAYPEYKVLQNGVYKGTVKDYYSNASIAEAVMQYGNSEFDPAAYAYGTKGQSGRTSTRQDDAGYNGYVVWQVWPVTTYQYVFTDTGGSYSANNVVWDKDEESEKGYNFSLNSGYGSAHTVLNMGKLQLIKKTEYHVSVTVYEEILHVTYVVGVNVFVRPPKQLIKMAGLLEGNQMSQYIKYLKEYYPDSEIAGLDAYDEEGNRRVENNGGTAYAADH